MADDVSGAGAVLDFYGEFLDIGIAGRGLFGDVVCRTFILEDVREVDRGDCGVDDFDAGGCFYRLSGRSYKTLHKAMATYLQTNAYCILHKQFCTLV